MNCQSLTISPTDYRSNILLGPAATYDNIRVGGDCIPNRIPKSKSPCKFLTYKGFFTWIAERTGLEPATSAVTGRHSNQLNYRSIFSNGIANIVSF